MKHSFSLPFIILLALLAHIDATPPHEDCQELEQQRESYRFLLAVLGPLAAVVILPAIINHIDILRRKCGKHLSSVEQKQES